MLTLACKLYLAEPATCEKLFRYVMEMARYDMDFDIRDRARMMRGILLEGKSVMIKDKAGACIYSYYVYIYIHMYNMYMCVYI